MSSPAGTIDGFNFARLHGHLSGVLDGAALPRLAEVGAAVESVDFAVDGVNSKLGKLALQVAATGRVSVQCQRCLEPVEVAIEVDQELELAATQAAIDGAEDEVDRVLATRTMDVAVLVEDELLLALPMVARHDGCQTPAEKQK